MPRSDVPGEEAARTQPFPKLKLHDTDARPLRFWNYTEAHNAGCQTLMAGVRYEGVFTPPSLQGTMLYPGNPGGTNWGSMAYDHGSRIGYLVVNRWPTIVKLIPRREFRAAKRKGTLNGVQAQHTAQNGTPFGMARTELVRNGLPCLAPPWSTLVAVDLDEGEVRWEVPAGIVPAVNTGGPWSRQVASCFWQCPPRKGCAPMTVPMATSYGAGNCRPVHIQRRWVTGTAAWTTWS